MPVYHLTPEGIQRQVRLTTRRLIVMYLVLLLLLAGAMYLFIEIREGGSGGAMWIGLVPGVVIFTFVFYRNSYKSIRASLHETSIVLEPSGLTWNQGTYVQTSVKFSDVRSIAEAPDGELRLRGEKKLLFLLPSEIEARDELREYLHQHVAPISRTERLLPWYFRYRVALMLIVGAFGLALFFGGFVSENPWFVVPSTILMVCAFIGTAVALRSEKFSGDYVRRYRKTFWISGIPVLAMLFRCYWILTH